MKRITAILIAFLLLALSACSGKSEPPTTAAPTVKRSDTLYITNGDKNYSACLERYYSVVEAMTNKVSVLEENHNLAVQAESGEKYFLEEDYILTPFRPFGFTHLELTEKFVNGMNTAKAKEEFAAYNNGMETQYSQNNFNGNLLKFISENTILSIETKYKSDGDSMQYTFTTETDGNEAITERLEFITVSPNVYAIQSTTARCYIEFDKDGGIVYFCCATLKNSTFGEKDSIFAATTKPGKDWISTDGEEKYSSIHTYENGTLYHSECTEGPWKTVTIDGEKYDSSFIQ